MTTIPSTWIKSCKEDADISSPQAYWTPDGIRIPDKYVLRAGSGVRMPDGVIMAKGKCTIAPDGLVTIPDPRARKPDQPYNGGLEPHKGLRVCLYQSVYDDEDSAFCKRFAKYCTPVGKHVDKIADPDLTAKFTSLNSNNYCPYCFYNALMDIRKTQIEAEEVRMKEEEALKKQEEDKALIELVAEETRLKIAKKEVTKKKKK